MVFSIRYTNDLTEHCNIYHTDKMAINAMNNNITNNGLLLNESFYTSNDYCLKYLTSDENKNTNKTSIDLGKIISSDWILKMSADNIKNYHEIFKEKNQENADKINDILINYSFMYFLTGITLLIINFFFVHFFNMLNDADEFQDITPKDFTILIHGVKKQKITRKQYLINLINEISDKYFKLEIHQIIPFYNLVELYKLTKEVFEDRTKIYHARNLKRQKDLNEKYKSELKNEIIDENETKPINTVESGMNIKVKSLLRNPSQISILNQNDENELNSNYNNIYYFSKFLCFTKAHSLNKIQERINKNKEKILEIEKDISQNPDNYNCGTYFIVFKYVKMRDQFYDFFPISLSSKIYYLIKYFFQNILFQKCVSEEKKRLNFIKISFKVEHATEAYEVLWKNLGYTALHKYLYLLLSICVTIILVSISLCIVLIFNHFQYILTEKNSKSKTFWKYLLSFLISIFISITNALGRYILEKVTSIFETIETRTGYYISLSAKISFFTFINTAIVPLLSNYIREEWGNNQILLNNVLMIFITNITLTPFIFYIGPGFILKISRRAKARLDLEDIPWEDSPYTQGELNEIFENPKMDLCYKYSFFINILLTFFFYMPIFPLGFVFGLVSLILSYFLETYYLGFYKRPEVLNARLAKFFIQNFKIVVMVFFLGNYIFFSSVNVHHEFNWALFNFIFFLVVVFIPYNDININILGITEGVVKKGAYEDYELMFPTDYEKQNPLTKKKAMIKYFKKLARMSLIDKNQSNYLIKNTNEESYMESYYKTSKNIGNILNSYEFQRQFIKSKKKYKFMKKIRQKKKSLIENGVPTESHISTENIINSKNLDNYNTINNSKLSKDINILDSTNAKKKRMSTIKEEKESAISEKMGNDNDNKNENNNANMILEKEKLKNSKKEKISKYMRKTLFQQIKNEGLYDDSEEESEDDSLESEDDDNDINNFIINNRKREGFGLSLLPGGFKKLNNVKISGQSKDINDKKTNTNISLYSMKTDFKAIDNNTNNNINISMYNNDNKNDNNN